MARLERPDWVKNRDTTLDSKVCPECPHTFRVHIAYPHAGGCHNCKCSRTYQSLVQGENMNTQKPDAVELLPCPFCSGNAELRNDDGEFWYVSCHECISQTTHFFNGRDIVIARWNTRDTAERDDLKAEVAAGKRLFAEMTVIEGKGWSISNNGNPSALIALRQFDGDGDLVSYTHHETALEAFAALEGESK